MKKSKIISKEEFVKRVSSHFGTEDPVEEIHRDLKALIENGYNRAEIQRLVEEYRMDLQNEGREEEDIMVDIITAFIGWSAKEWQL